MAADVLDPHRMNDAARQHCGAHADPGLALCPDAERRSATGSAPIHASGVCVGNPKSAIQSMIPQRRGDIINIG